MRFTLHNVWHCANVLDGVGGIGAHLNHIVALLKRGDLVSLLNVTDYLNQLLAATPAD